MKLGGKLIAVLIFAFMIPIIISNIDNYKDINTVQRQLTTKSLGEPEDIVLLNDPDIINSVKADGVLLQETIDYTVSGNVVTIKANVTDVDCCVQIDYNYTLQVDESVNSIIIILPFLLTAIFVIYYFKSKK